MAIIDSRMQQKRGHLAKLDKSKLLPGEFAVPDDSDSIFVCIASGVVLEIASKQAMQNLLDSLDALVVKGNQIIADFEKLELDKVGIDDDNTSVATTFSSSKIMQLIDAINEFSISIVQELPTEGIDTHTIYFIPKENSESGDVYDEYIYINNLWEHIGSTAIDLSDYYNKSQVDSKVDGVQTQLDSIIDVYSIALTQEDGTNYTAELTFDDKVLGVNNQNGYFFIIARAVHGTSDYCIAIIRITSSATSISIVSSSESGSGAEILTDDDNNIIFKSGLALASSSFYAAVTVIKMK